MSVANQRVMTAVPRLRFPEFRDSGGWKLRKLSYFLAEQKERNKNQNFGPKEVLSVSGEYGCINQIELLGRSYAGTSVANYHIVETGDIVYTKSPLKRNPFGIIKENKGEPGIVSTLYAVYRATGSGCPAFLDHYFSGDYNLNSYLQPIVRKGAKNDMKVNNAAVLGGEIFAPQIEEQKKVAHFLTSLDDLIVVQARKVEALKIHKCGMMQKLFPRKGETSPRLRFPEFRDAPQWVIKKLSALIDLVSGTHLSPEQYGSSGDVPYFTGPSDFTNEMKCVTKWTAVSSSMATKYDTLITVKGSGVGECWYLEMPSVVMGRQLMAIHAKASSSQFIHQFLLTKRKRFEDLASGNLIPGLARGDILDMVAPFPEKDEQQCIADCLSSLDARIAAESNQLAKLKTHKQSLMQQLFPTPGAS